MEATRHRPGSLMSPGRSAGKPGGTGALAVEVAGRVEAPVAAAGVANGTSMATTDHETARTGGLARLDVVVLVPMSADGDRLEPRCHGRAGGTLRRTRHRAGSGKADPPANGG